MRAHGPRAAALDACRHRTQQSLSRRTLDEVTTLAGVHAVLAPHRYDQEVITDAFARVCLGADGNPELARRLHANTQVHSRHLALPIDDYAALPDFGAANDAFIELAGNLGVDAVAGAL